MGLFGKFCVFGVLLLKTRKASNKCKLGAERPIHYEIPKNLQTQSFFLPSLAFATWSHNLRPERKTKRVWPPRRCSCPFWRIPCFATTRLLLCKGPGAPCFATTRRFVDSVASHPCARAARICAAWHPCARAAGAVLISSTCLPGARAVTICPRWAFLRRGRGDLLSFGIRAQGPAVRCALHHCSSQDVHC